MNEHSSETQVHPATCADSVGTGAPQVQERYARGGEELSSAPTIVCDSAGRLVFAFNDGKVVVAAEAFAEASSTLASSPE
jgi:hypothetical protein